ncbi:MAG: hypothetical protein MI799_07105, partial [Desulfobacterales bacterium]|nr:hypothetical protein [Desulfobacterales bacterium]
EMFGDPVRNDKGWDIIGFDELIQSTRNGQSPSKSGEVTGFVYTLSAITGDSFREIYKEAKFSQVKNVYFPSVDDFLVCRGNGNINLVGKAYFYPGDKDFVMFPDTMIAITIKPDSINKVFLEQLWKTHYIRSQIEKNARTANGTYKINQNVIKSMTILNPPSYYQNQFATIAEKVEGIKTQYQQSLTELENLYAALSPKAFKGELNLSRIPMPVEPDEANKKPAKTEPESVLPEHKKRFEFSTPDQNQRMVLSSAEGRKPILRKWMDEYLQWSGKDAAFSVDSFMKEAQQKLDELDREAMLSGQGAEGAEPVLGINDYDHLKEWVFDQVRSGRIEQTRNLIKMDDKEELGNTIILKHA